MQPVGGLLALECTVKGTSVPYLYWYRQFPGGTPALLFSSVNVDQLVRETPQNFTALRPTDGQFILNSEKLLLSDSGFYLRAWSVAQRWVGQTSVQNPTLSWSPDSGAGWSILGGLVISPCENNRIKPDSSRRTLLSSQGEQKDISVPDL